MDEIHVHKTKKSICAHFAESPCRKFSKSYLKMAFTSVLDNDNEKLQCVLYLFCSEQQSNKAIKAFKLVEQCKACIEKIELFFQCSMMLVYKLKFYQRITLLFGTLLLSQASVGVNLE